MPNESLEISHKPQLTVTSEQAKIARNTIAKGLSDDEFAIFLYNCQRQGIHPLDGLLVPISRNDKDEGKRLTFVTTVDLLRSRAAESNEYAGNDDAHFVYGQGEYPETATVTVWRNVEMSRCAFTASARWTEYYPGDKQGFMWRNKPHVMLGKCAEALALRKAFPKQLAGLYLAEELQRESIQGNQSRPPARKQEKPVGDVVCADCRQTNGHAADCKYASKGKCPECRAEGGHLPSCKYRKTQEAQTQEAEPEKKPETLKWLVQVEAIDTREKTVKDKAGKESKRPYRMLTCINAANENVTLYAWDTKHYERIDAIKEKTRCVFSVKSSVSGNTTYYSIEEIIEITGEKKQAEPQDEMLPPEEK